MLEHKSFPSLPIVANGCEALVSSYQNCYRTVKFILQPPASFPCSHCCPGTSVLVWQITCFLIAPSDCRINSILLNETFKVLCFSWLSKDPIAAKWIYALSSDSPETASLDLWRLIWYPGAEWCPWTPLSLWLFPGNSTIHQLLCSGCFTVLLLHKARNNVISLRYCSLLQSMSKHIFIYFCLSPCAPVLQTHLSR